MFSDLDCLDVMPELGGAELQTYEEELESNVA